MICVGGPFNGQDIKDHLLAYNNFYRQYNCASKINRSKLAKKKAIEYKQIIPPSSVWLYIPLLQRIE